MFFSLPNQSAMLVTELADPWNFVSKAPTNIDKDTFRAWSANPTTQHAFISLIEGPDPSLRTTAKGSNPPYQIHGIIADYDSDIPANRLSLAYLQSRQKAGQLPNWICRSQSGGVHAFWLFDQPIAVHHAEQARQFLAHALKQLKASSLYPNLGKESADPYMYYEIGRQWTPIEPNPVPTTLIWYWLYEAGEKTEFNDSLKDVQIPFDLIEKRVHELYPNQWDNSDFSEHARGRAFWLPNSKTLRCAVVRKGGMQCFLSSEPPFIPWPKLLGAEWCEQFHADRVGAVLQNLFYLATPPRYYHLRALNPENLKVEEYNKEDAAILLRAEYGISNKVSDNGLREVENVLHRLRVEKKVDAVGPLIYRPIGPVTRGQETFLNTSRVRALPPAPEHNDQNQWGKGFPLIADIFRFLFAQPKHMVPTGKHPLEYFLGHLRVAYAHAIAMKPTSGQVVFLCGPPDIGKTLMMNMIVAPLLGGRGAIAAPCENFAFGRTEFNSELSTSPTWVIDDKKPDSKREHDHYTNFIKTTAAVQNLRVRQLYSNALTTTWLGRLFILMNLDSTSTYLLPNMERSMKEKVHLFYCMGHRKYKFPPKQEGDKQLRQELPYFARWLLSWKIPQSLLIHPTTGRIPRFGIMHYHDTQVLAASFKLGSTYGFFDSLVLFLRTWKLESPNLKEWRGTPAQLSHEMSNSIFRGQGGAKELSPTMVGIQLNRLAARGTGITMVRGKSRDWIIPFDIIDKDLSDLEDEYESNDIALDVTEADATIQELEERNLLPTSMVESVEKIDENWEALHTETEEKEDGAKPESL